ncbi:MAG: iron export ABC transporter permease subunit FetB [gamma proteobacterium symbiont of Bathyaustriella thionipta]|nr:iron export ABC transporter permease subunit FetB [gamma proteobacterium symbiont of Bathyaustriella thionipta]MCU7950508.1 iron export ABC transporter permease subunit FetB [gamma proteobacterium symbiont of Bathyaustriella thionipta]MCU7953243.1 iron export ABC transporter permease subunit FetB [gamma proteobacterium symbiont of Bathyaustriella thionipta]MCU7957002.1 iron export ABC transporter permease subunit FetB [gamma proteobacterium symbiont of Bathyaustriella thionipta]MCU7965938.1 
MIHLTPWDLVIASGMIILLAITSLLLQLNIARQLTIAAIRNVIQLLLIGYILKLIFNTNNLFLLASIACIMLLVAGYEINARQKYPLKRWVGFKVGTSALFLSSFAMVLLTLMVIVAPTPWYSPQYAIPLLGMLLGNTMNGISLGMDKLNQSVYQQRAIIEQRLMLGQSYHEAIKEIRTESIRTGMIPIINSMAIAGLVSLPGMMTGQILSGTPPVEAVKYQILIFFLIASGTGFGIMLAVWMIAKRMFDDRQRLDLAILKVK